MMAHVNEHVGFEYRRQVEQAMGMPLPVVPEGEDPPPMSPEVADRVAQLAAQASQQLLGQHQQEAAQQQAQQQAQDPLIQLQAQELQLKAKDISIKERKLIADAAAKADQLNIEKERINSQERIAGMNASLKAQNDKAQLAARQHMDGARITVDYAKAKDQIALARENRQHAKQTNKKEENK